MNKWHFDTVYNKYIISRVLRWGHEVGYKVLDRGMIEYVGRHGITEWLRVMMKRASKYQSGVLYNYGLTMIMMMVVYIYMIENMG